MYYVVLNTSLTRALSTRTATGQARTVTARPCPPAPQW